MIQRLLNLFVQVHDRLVNLLGEALLQHFTTKKAGVERLPLSHAQQRQR